MEETLRVYNQQKDEITGATFLVLRKIGDSAHTYIRGVENKLISRYIFWNESDTDDYNIEKLSEKMTYELAIKANAIIKGMTDGQIKYLDKDLNDITGVLFSFYEHEANCEVFEFYINGKHVENDCDIITHEDTGEGRQYCVNNQVILIEPTEEVLEQYNISEDEFRFIQQKVKVCFVEGSCNWCI